MMVGSVHTPNGVEARWQLAALTEQLFDADFADHAGTIEPISLAPPVRGAWLAVNSPGQQVPSHGTRALGQLSAADLVHPDQRARNTWPSLAWFFTGENILRTVLGWWAVVGNRVVIKHDDGTYSAYIHLKPAGGHAAQRPGLQSMRVNSSQVAS